MRSQSVVSSIGALALVVAIVRAFPNGAPDTACSNFDPDSHGPSTADGPNPYRIALSSTTYTPGSFITVTLYGAPFKGYLLEGWRADGSSSSAVGFFQNPPPGAKLVCTASLRGNGVTHTDRSVKNQVTFDWRAPPTLEGDITFKFTVVRGGGSNSISYPSDYFASVTSGILRPSSDVPRSRNEEPLFGKPVFGKFLGRRRP